MFVDLATHLKDMQTLLGPEAVAFKKAVSILGRHANLRAYRDHMGIIRLCSFDVNPIATGIDVTHRSTECGGSIEVMPYLVEEGISVYSDPPLFVVGYSNPHGFGEVPLKDWSDLLADAGLSRTVITKVRSYLGGHAPVDFSEVP